MRKLLDRYYRFCFNIAATGLCLICLTVAIQVFFNLVNKGSSFILGESLGWQLPSYGDFTGYFLVATTFFAGAHTFRVGGHIRVQLILQRIGTGAARRLVELFSCSIVVFAIGMGTYYSLLLCMESYKYGDVSPGLIPVPIWIPQVVMVVGLFSLWVAVVDTLVQFVRNEAPPYMVNTSTTSE